MPSCPSFTSLSEVAAHLNATVRNGEADHNSLATAETSLEAVMAEVYRIIHLQDPNYVVSSRTRNSHVQD